MIYFMLISNCNLKKKKNIIINAFERVLGKY